MYKELKYFLIMELLFSGIAFANLTVKSINYMNVAITRSGRITTQGDVRDVCVYLYAPKNFYDIKSPNNYSFVEDKFGNKMIKLKTTENYSVTFFVRQFAKYGRPTKLVRGNDEFTNLTEYNREMERYSFGKSSLEGFVKMLKYVSSFKYDKNLSNVQMPADWVFEHKRGTCDEFSNCLVSLAKLAGIKARAVVGYAYRSPNDKILGNHAWIQIFTDDGWVDADPTWKEFGYLDASHIPVAFLPDTNMSEHMRYTGSGYVHWIKNPDTFKIIEMNYSKPIKMEGGYYGGDNGVLFVKLIGPCYMADLNPLSCVSDGRTVLDIYDKKRLVWFCRNKTVYWAYNSYDFNGVCPTNIYDQSGVMTTVDVKSKKTSGNVRIISPDNVVPGEEFEIRAVGNKRIIFSPNISIPNASVMRLKLFDPGLYKFYAFGGNLCEKDVAVVSKRDFNLSVSCPKEVSGKFNVTVGVVGKDVRIKVKYGDQIYYDKYSRSSTKNFTFVSNPKFSEVEVIASDGSVEIKTVSIKIKKDFKYYVGRIIDFFSGLLKYFSSL